MSERLTRYTRCIVLLWTAHLTTPQLGTRFNRRPAHDCPGGWVIKVSDSKSKKWCKVTSWSFTSTASVLEHKKPVFRKEKKKQTKKTSKQFLKAEREPLKRSHHLSEVQIQHGNQITKWDEPIPTHVINTPLTAWLQAACSNFPPDVNHIIS